MFPIIIRTFSAAEIVKTNIANDYVISISEIGAAPKFMVIPQELLVLGFCDDEADFSADQAKQIISFFNEAYALNHPLAIHCFAGASRSVAVALALADLFPSKVKAVLFDGILPISPDSYLLYNRHVFSTIQKEVLGDLLGN